MPEPQPIHPFGQDPGMQWPTLFAQHPFGERNQRIGVHTGGKAGSTIGLRRVAERPVASQLRQRNL